MMILIPAAIGMAALAYPIMGVLFPQKATIMMATKLLIFGSPAIVFYGLSTLTNGILQALGEVNVPLRNAAFFSCVSYCYYSYSLFYYTI